MIIEIILYFAILASIVTNIYLFAIYRLQKKIKECESKLLYNQIELLENHNKFLEDFLKIVQKKTN